MTMDKTAWYAFFLTLIFSPLNKVFTQIASKNNSAAAALKDNSADVTRVATEKKTLAKPVFQEAESFDYPQQFSVDHPEYFAVHFFVNAQMPLADVKTRARNMAMDFWKRGVPLAVFFDRAPDNAELGTVSTFYNYARQEAIDGDDILNGAQVAESVDELVKRFKDDRKPGGRVYKYLNSEVTTAPSSDIE